MRLRSLALPACLLLALSFGPRATATQTGDSRETVLAEKGTPVSTLESGAKTILQFSEGTMITLVDNKVTLVEQHEPPQVTTTQASQTGPYQGSITADKKRIILSVGAACLTAALLFRLFFTDFQGFIECLRFYFQPDLISAFRGEWWEDKWGSAKLAFWLFLSAGVGALVFFHLQ